MGKPMDVDVDPKPLKRKGSPSGSDDSDDKLVPKVFGSDGKPFVNPGDQTVKESFNAKAIAHSDKSDLPKQKMPHRYNVIDFFMVDAIWHEKIGEDTGVKFRLQKLDLSKKSWWAEKGSPDPTLCSERDFDLTPDSHTCGTCNTTNHRVYRNMEMCLNNECPEFWKVNGVDPPETRELDPNFLAWRQNYDLKKHLDLAPHELIPQIPDITPENHREYRSGDKAKMGIVCSQCGRCLPRIKLNGWRCDFSHMNIVSYYNLENSESRDNDTGCTWSLLCDPDPIRVEGLIDLDSLSRFYANPHSDISGEAITKSSDYTSFAPYKMEMYTIAGVGTVTHFISNTDINQNLNGPNHLFESFQINDLGLRRHRPDKIQDNTASAVTNQFLVNIGLRYQNFTSLHFYETHRDVRLAYARLDWAIRRVVLASRIQYELPNELSIIGYVKNMAMEFHDDGTVGSAIATLSLGERATMTFRMKQEYYYGCRNYNARRELKDKFDGNLLTKKEYDDQRKEVCKKAGTSPVCLTIQLYHGHMTVMNGTDIQKYYEHCVTPDGGLRFAVTARHVPENTVPREDLSKGQIELDVDDFYDGDPLLA
ncbi:hypothetical protein N7478_008244 [Penicillium angulare]|uniref:uncharacterized protein n=1 Tax=Penicillium angulare TaxID=116970 RepID=UPI00253F7594|nr:uncharacterized protein N7478_008244 [Penicillium angulare]KAJ5273119.1 hypothetical protein N7478_008244 [Penicillium angulare]